MSVKVAVRVRPFNQRQKFLGCLNCIQMKQKTTILINPRDRSQKQYQFTFDYSFWSHDGYEQLENGYLYPIDDRFVDQKKIFKQLGEDILKNAWNGFNCCLFAYGQTGAGKSYSMIGYESNRGIVPMTCQKIFEGIQKLRTPNKKEFEVTISMLQIYNEKVQDLFIHTSKRPTNGLKIRQSKKVGVYVQGITRFQVRNYAEIERKMEDGAKNRSLASTLMNQYSSRAHTIVMIEFVQKQFITEQKMNKKTSLLNLVDLAGSERIAKTGISDKDRLKQASQINKSLHTLGRVIENLAELSLDKNKNVQIPYRQSALTRILETALGGNSVTTMICAISPANDNYEETLSTLRYADQTKKIKNKPIINESAVDKIIRELREQNERLKQMLRIAKLKGINLQLEQPNILSNIIQIQREISKNMQSFAINTDGMDDDTSLTISQFVDVPDPNDFYTGELTFDSMNSSAFGNNRANVFITNLNEDRQLCFKIKYSCQEELLIGNKNMKDNCRNKLVLCGLGVEDRHARIFPINNRYYIQPLCEHAIEYTLLNGRTVDKKTEIFHNSRIIFGTNSVFLFKNFNQKAKKQITNTKVGGSDSPQKVLGKTRVDCGVGGVSPEQKSKSKRQQFGIDPDYDDINEQLLLDWEQLKLDKKSNSLQSTAKASIQIDGETELAQQDSIDEKLLDYQFAINERQNRMFETTPFQSSLKTHKSDIEIKLSEIEKQFNQLKEANQKKMKEKQELFVVELKKLEIEKEVEKAKLKEELKIKQQEAKKIAIEKERIEKIRDKLLEIERERKQKQRKMMRESLLIGDDEEESANIEWNNQQTIVYTERNLKKKQEVNIENPRINPEQTKQTNKFHLGNSLQTTAKNEIKIEEIIKQHKETVQSKNIPIDVNANNQICNKIQNNIEPNLIDLTEPSKIDISKAIINQTIAQKQTQKSFKLEKVFTINYFPPTSPNKVGQQHQQYNQQIPRKKSLTIHSTVNATPSSPTKNQQQRQKQRQIQKQKQTNQFQIQQQHNQFIQTSNEIQKNEPANKEQYGKQQKFNDEISLNLSDDIQNNYLIREQQLLQQIRQYEIKLKKLQQASKQKKQTIINMRKSFANEFGQNPSLNNFQVQSSIFEGEIDLSAIDQKSIDTTIALEVELEKKMKMNIIECQNENIINERSLQVRKRKREAQELKKIFIKKEKRELQKKLIELIPMLEKFNLWASSMNKNIEGKIEIQYHNFSNSEIIEALKYSLQGKINIIVKISNYQEGRTYKWPIEVFKNRFEIAENLFERYLQNPINIQHPLQQFLDNNKNPFWDPIDFQPYAVGYLSLQPLSYALNFQGQIRFVHKGQTVGYIQIKLQSSIIDNNASKIKQKFGEESQQNQIYDPRQLLERDLTFNLVIERFKPSQYLSLDKVEKYCISYEILQDCYKTQIYRTEQISINRENVGYSIKHNMINITENTLAYLADSPCCFTLNLLFSKDQEMSNLFSSFSQHNEQILNISRVNEKPPNYSQPGLGQINQMTSFQKKKPTTIMENPDVLTKIQKEYSSKQKLHQSNIQMNKTKKKNKGKSKNSEDCIVF